MQHCFQNHPFASLMHARTPRKLWMTALLTPASPPTPALDKASLRRNLLATRQALAADAAQAPHLNALLGEQLARLLSEHCAACVGFYWPMAGEFDARATLAAWLAGDPGRQAALPVVSSRDAPLTFHVWHPDAAMRMGRYNIPIPAADHPVQTDLLLVPCVGFDAARLRLGYGGGYYDRTLASLQPRPYTVGLAFECARVAALPREPHDVPLDMILTETGQY